MPPGVLPFASVSRRRRRSALALAFRFSGWRVGNATERHSSRCAPHLARYEVAPRNSFVVAPRAESQSNRRSQKQGATRGPLTPSASTPGVPTRCGSLRSPPRYGQPTPWGAGRSAPIRPVLLGREAPTRWVNSSLRVEFPGGAAPTRGRVKFFVLEIACHRLWCLSAGGGREPLRRPTTNPVHSVATAAPRPGARRSVGRVSLGLWPGSFNVRC